MDKLKTKILLISLLLIMLLSLQGAAAASDDGNLTSENIDLSICDNEGDVGSDNVLAATNSEDMLGEVDGSFGELQDLIDSHYNSELTLNKSYTYNNDQEIAITGPITIYGNGNTLNANNGCFIFIIRGDNVVLQDIVFTNGNATDGGAILWQGENGTITNCNFTNNHALENGGAVLWGGDNGNLANCDFTNNNASFIGAISWTGNKGTLTNSNFTNNKATSHAGAVHWWGEDGNLTNCKFTNNTALENGGAVHWVGEDGNLANCNFTNNNATQGGAVYWTNEGGYGKNGKLTNCNFTNNTASNGGAVEWNGENGELTNCSFTNNHANDNGGAIRFSSTGVVINCNFTNNTATNGRGGAINMGSGSVTNCNFTNNTASEWGGAIIFWHTGNVTNCNFTGNNATTGSAIYFYSTSATKTVSNSCLLNNRANAETLEVTKNDNNITITFTGNDNLLNAIYSRNDAEVTFTNVTYWSANGINNTGNSVIKPSRSNKEAGQNITVSIVVDDVLVLSDVKVTNENGTIVLDIKAGENYFIGVRHDTDSYYTEKANTTSNNTKFHVNVTSKTTNNRTVNITAKSNIPDEVIKGKLLFCGDKAYI